MENVLFSIIREQIEPETRTDVMYPNLNTKREREQTWADMNRLDKGGQNEQAAILTVHFMWTERKKKNTERNDG